MKNEKKVLIRGVSPSLTSKDKTKRTLCVGGMMDGKRVEFDPESTSFYFPVMGEMQENGMQEVSEVIYQSSDFKINGKVWRIFHPSGYEREDIFQALMDNYIGAKQVKILKKKYGVPVENTQQAKYKTLK